MTEPENREAPRSSIFLIVNFRHYKRSGEYILGISNNFSLTGINIESQSSEYGSGEVLDMILKHPATQMEVSVRGEVAWKKEGWYKCMMGVKFMDMDRETESRLSELISGVNKAPDSPPLAPGAVPITAGTDMEKKPGDLPVPEKTKGYPYLNKTLSDKISDREYLANTLSELNSPALNDPAVTVTGRSIKPSKADHLNIPGPGTGTTGQNRPAQPAEQTMGEKPSVKKPRKKFRPLFAVIIIMIASAASAVIVRFEDIRNALHVYIPVARSLFPVEPVDTSFQGPGENVNIPVSPETGGPVLSDEHTENILLPAENSSGVHIADNGEVFHVQPESVTTGKEPAPAADLRATITFNINSDTVDPEFYPVIERLIKAFSEKPGAVVRVEGHTDNMGPEIYNINLSMRRAIAVKGILTKKGIAGEKIKIALFGGSEPEASNDTLSGRMKNRRVEIVLVPAGTE